MEGPIPRETETVPRAGQEAQGWHVIHLGTTALPHALGQGEPDSGDADEAAGCGGTEAVGGGQKARGASGVTRSPCLAES